MGYGQYSQSIRQNTISSSSSTFAQLLSPPLILHHPRYNLQIALRSHRLPVISPPRCHNRSYQGRRWNGPLHSRPFPFPLHCRRTRYVTLKDLPPVPRRSRYAQGCAEAQFGESLVAAEEGCGEAGQCGGGGVGGGGREEGDGGGVGEVGGYGGVGCCYGWRVGGHGLGGRRGAWRFG